MTKSKKAKGENKVGRPLKFETVEELETAINMYFNKCDEEYDTRRFAHEAIVQNEKGEAVCMNCGLPGWRRGCLVASGKKKVREPYTITGLALALHTTRETLMDYQEKDEYSDAVKDAKVRCHNYLEIHGLHGEMAPAKAIFALSNYGWKNPQHIDHTTAGKEIPAAQNLIYMPAKKAEGVE
jgi:hypothetical protein